MKLTHRHQLIQFSLVRLARLGLWLPAALVIAWLVVGSLVRPARFTAAAQQQQGNARAARLAEGDQYEGGKAPAPLKAPNNPAVQTGVTIYAYNFANNHLLKFDAGEPGTILGDLPLTGLDANEFLEGLDFRPADGLLYGEASNGTLDRLVQINTTTGACTQIGITVSKPTGTFMGLDFNPVTADDLTQVTDADIFRRLSATQGWINLTGLNLAYVAGDPGFGANPNVVHLAYNNNFAGAQTTTLFGIDSSRDTLVRLGGVNGNPTPDFGQLTTIGPLGVDVTAFGGFDIARYGSVYAVLRVAGVSQLFSINLNSGAATLIGSVGGAPTIDGIAIDPLCPFTVTPATFNVSAAGGTNSVTLQTNGSGCGWTAVSNANWITVNSTANGVDDATVTFTTTANVSGAQRSGTLSIAGKTVTITQTAGACPGNATVSYSGPAVNIPDNSAAGVTIPLQVSGVGTITDLNFRFDTAGTCDATVGNTSSAVSHTFVGDLVFKLTSPQGTTVTLMNRRGGTRENICLTTLDDDGGFPALSTITGVTGQFVSGNFAPDTPLSAFDGQNANGTWTLNVSDNSANDTGQLRRFSLLFNSECAPPVCNYQAAPSTFNLSGAGGNGTINVTTACAWTTLSNAPWIIVDSGVNSSGNGTATFHVSTNFGVARSSSLTVAGQTITVNQDAQCIYQLSLPAISAGVAGGNGTVDVVAGMGCPWTAVSNNPWLSVVSGASGAGNGTVTYAVQPNNGNAPRTGTLTIAGKTFTVTQAAAATCSGNPPITVSYNGPAVAIPDNVPAGVNIPLQVSGVGTISDLNFSFDTGGTCDANAGNTNAALDHTHLGDLTFKLTSPSGTTVTFISRRGAGSKNICQTLLNDEGGFASVSTLFGNPVTGNYTPEATGQFLSFDGQNANGTWILNVSDNAVVDIGSLRRFSLIFNSCDGCNYQLSTNGYNAPPAGAQSSVDVTCGANCTWTAQSNANWIAINNGASGNGNGTVTFTVAPNPGAQRSGTLTIGNQTFTVTQAVNCGTIIINPALLSNATVGTQYNQTFSALGGVALYSFNLAQGSTLPPGLSIVNGALSGTPLQAGAFPFTIQVVDANGCTGTKQYALVVNPACGTLSINPATVPTMFVSVPYSQQLTANGGTAPYAFSTQDGLFTGLTLSPSGLLSGTPAAAGQLGVVINVTDANGCTGSRNYGLTSLGCPTFIFAPNTLPVGTVGTAYSQQITASGGVAPYTYDVSSGTLPPGITLSATGLVSGTPTASGQYPANIRATDANGCVSASAYGMTINVACPVITFTPATLPPMFIGTPFNQQLTANGGTGPYTFSPNGALLNGFTLSPAGLLSGTPAGAGQFTISVNVTDANGCTGSKVYNITITSCPTITVSPNTLPAGTVGTAYNQQITASGGVAPYTYTISAGVLPAGLNLTAAGLLSGTPTAAGAPGITIKATDANGCMGTQPYTFTVNAACPTINIGPNPPSPALIGVAYNHTFNATGGTAPYTFSLAQGPIPDGLTLSTAGVLSGTPTGNNGGGFAFTVKATDANGCMGQVQFGLTISSCPTITVNPATLPNGQMGTAYNQTISASGGGAPYSYSLSVGSLPAGLNLSSAGALTGTPTVSGQFTFTAKATDANGCAGARQYTLTINNASCPSITVNPATLPVATAGVVFNQTITQTGGTGTIAWSVSAGALPAGWTLNTTTGQLSGLALTAGQFNFTVKATDANGCTGTRAYTLTMRPKAKADFDGDGKSDLSVWTGATGDWKALKSGNGASFNLPWGAGYAPYFDVIVPGDYDGDGKADHAIWRGADSIWYIRKSSDGQAILDLWGANYAPYNDIPTPGDFDGDGKTDLAVWRPTTGTWYVKKSSDGSNLIVQHGQQGDVPLAVDFDGDGKCDFGLFRPSAIAPTPNWLILQSSNNTLVSLQWGGGYAPYFDMPVPADYDGDGKADLAIWRGQDSIWYIRPSANPNNPILELWGANYAPYFDTPCPADYDGDGKADIAVWRKDGTWYVKRSTNGTSLIQVHGQQGDVPVPAYGVK